MGENNNFEMKLGFIMDFIDNANDEQISELFNKVVDIVNGKSKPVTIPFQPVNPIPYFSNPIVVTLPNVMKPNYQSQITCDMCSEYDLDNDDLGDYFNWLGR